MNFKRFVRLIACLLVCVAALSSMAGSTQALNAAGSLFDTNLIPQGPDVSVEAETSGYLASMVYRSASFGSQEIGCFRDGTKLNVLGKKGSFYKVDCYDMVGYIPKSQVRVTENEEYFVQCIVDSSETVKLPSYTMQQTLTLRHNVLEEAKKYIGIRYVSGGSTPRGFDCSGYTQYVFRNIGVDIFRHELDQMTNSIIIPKEEMQCGDLVLFSYTGENGGFASHIGIYVGNNKVIHASSSKGITISDLDAPYYAKHYQCSRRILLAEEAPSVSLPVTGVMQNTGNSFWREDTGSNNPFRNN